MKKFNKILDFYLLVPLLIDVVIVLLLFIFGHYYPLIKVKILDKSNEINLIGNLISTSVSLAGFILAALTIIVSFKANLKANKLEDYNNALELILSTHNYKRIVKVFKDSLIELVCVLVVLYFSWLISDTLSKVAIWWISYFSILLISLSLLRSLLILFLLLKMENFKKDE